MARYETLIQGCNDAQSSALAVQERIKLGEGLSSLEADALACEGTVHKMEQDVKVGHYQVHLHIFVSSTIIGHDFNAVLNCFYPTDLFQELASKMISWSQSDESNPGSLTLDQLNSQSVAFFETSKRLRTRVDAAAKSVDELRARVTSDLARLKKGGGATAAVTSVHRKALLGLQSRLDGLFARVARAGGVCLQLMQSASELKSQAEAIPKLSDVLKRLLSGPISTAQVTSNGILSRLTVALDAASNTAANMDSTEGSTGHVSSDGLVAALSDRAILRQEANTLVGQARNILIQVEAIAAEGRALQVSGDLRLGVGLDLCSGSYFCT